MVHGHIQVFSNIDVLLDALLEQWQTIAAESIAARGAFHVALAGGSTPRRFYARLAKATIEWDRVHLYFGDERCVPQDHPDSNYRMARESLFSQVPIPVSQVHAMYFPPQDAEQDEEGAAEQAAQNSAARYSALLEDQLPEDTDGHPVFDLLLLGMGEDGHTASLFPGTEILDESQKSVAAQFVDKLAAWRVSLTYPTINAARHVALLVVGEAKASVLSQLSQETTNTLRYPVQGIHPLGDLQWYLDKAAARLIEGPR